MVSFKESFHYGFTKYNQDIVLGKNNMLCKLMFDKKPAFRQEYHYIYIVSTTENPFLFTFKTI